MTKELKARAKQIDEWQSDPNILTLYNKYKKYILHCWIRIVKSIEIFKEKEFLLSSIDNEKRNEILREGISKEDIVLAFHDPESRKFTDFAIA